jgi:hypothetical protein
VFDIRRISEKFGIVFFLEIVIFSYILYLGYSTIDDESQRIINFGSILASLAVVLLTTSLVYYNILLQFPEMAFTGFLIEPMLEDKHAAKNEYMENVAGGKQVRNDVYSRKFPKIKKVECESSPSFLKLKNDITNLGLLEGNIHEIRYYMNYPKQKHPYILPKRCSLLHQQRKTIELPFPISEMKDWGENLKKGILIFKFEGIGATKKFEKEIWIHISDDRKTIEWSESKLIISITKFWIRIFPPNH